MVSGQTGGFPQNGTAPGHQFRHQNRQVHLLPATGQEAFRACTTPPGAYVSKRLIDTSQEKFQESAGLRRWAEIENFKTAASAYSKVSSTADLEQRIAEQSALSRSVNWRNWSSILVRNEMMNQNIKK